MAVDTEAAAAKAELEADFARVLAKPRKISDEESDMVLETVLAKYGRTAVIQWYGMSGSSWAAKMVRGFAHLMGRDRIGEVHAASRARAEAAAKARAAGV